MCAEEGVREMAPSSYLLRVAAEGEMDGQQYHASILIVAERSVEACSPW
jgi:hypothetical protein